MAGTAEQGIEAAQPGLFVNAPYVLTPTTKTTAQGLSLLMELIEHLGAKLYQCSPEEHDQAVAWISHLPVMVSASLIGACGSEENAQILQLAQQLASSGFRDTYAGCTTGITVISRSLPSASYVFSGHARPTRFDTLPVIARIAFAASVPKHKMYSGCTSLISCEIGRAHV